MQQHSACDRTIKEPSPEAKTERTPIELDSAFKVVHINVHQARCDCVYDAQRPKAVAGNRSATDIDFRRRLIGRFPVNCIFLFGGG